MDRGLIFSPYKIIYVITGLKRGRKKQLHPQQVLTPERIKEVVTNNLIQCGLCEIVIPANDEAKHLQVRHHTRTDSS